MYGLAVAHLDTISASQRRFTRSLAPKEIVVSLKDLANVECVILLHLLLHQVLHDLRIEGVEGLFIRCVLVFRVVKQRLAGLWRVLIELTIAYSSPIVFARFKLRATARLWQVLSAGSSWLRLILAGTAHLGDLIN